MSLKYVLSFIVHDKKRYHRKKTYAKQINYTRVQSNLHKLYKGNFSSNIRDKNCFMVQPQPVIVASWKGQF